MPQHPAIPLEAIRRIGARMRHTAEEVVSELPESLEQCLAELKKEGQRRH